jgi:hypothetical protein
MKSTSIGKPKTTSVAPVTCAAKLFCSARAPHGKTFAIGLLNGTRSVHNSDNAEIRDT